MKYGILTCYAHGSYCPQNRYNELIRDAMVAINGAGIYGNIPAGTPGNFEYYLLSGAINANAEQGYGKYLSDTFGGLGEMNGNPDAKTMFSGNLKWRPNWVESVPCLPKDHGKKVHEQHDPLW